MATSQQPQPSKLTLWEIEAGIAELFDALEDADTPEARQACEQALAEYAAREVQKVDGIAALYRQFDVLAHEARAEAQRLTERARAFETRRDRVKQLVQTVMESNGLTRLEGRTSRLLLKGNGGLKPLEVTDPCEVPAECCKYIGWINAELWKEIRGFWDGWLDGRTDEFNLERVVDNDRVRKAITAEGGVPGARLGERGKHVEVK